ncbi:MAG: amino acid adenylation domain-containing protein, partial [Pyrinomonadaceae bacterium]
PEQVPQMPGVEVGLESIESGTAKFDLSLAIKEVGEGMNCTLRYRTDLFEAATVRRMLERFSRVLEKVVADPHIRLSQLDLLDEEERRLLLVEWNETAVEYPRQFCIHHLFEQQAVRTPAAIAVMSEDASLTYEELNRRSNELARFLRAQGVEAETRVGLMVERSVEMVVGMLGVLKAGAAYVPLDPSYPHQRVSFILEDAGISVLLTQAELMPGLENDGVRVVRLEEDWQTIAQEHGDNFDSGASAENAAYIIYTSGSTGMSKGVVIEHRQLTNYLFSINEKLTFPPNASFATVSTFAADLGHTMLFPSLCMGGTLHLISSERASSPTLLGEYFQHHQIDCLKIVPSHMSALLACADAAKVIPRQRLVLGGEASTWELIDKLHTLSSTCAINNHYGPTETTVGVLTYPVERAQDERLSSTVPLGRPIANTQIYILDQHLRPVPVGVTGELYIGGEGLARGYVNRPEQTAEKFLPHPFTHRAGERLYRTGDIARYLADGNIEFLGRADAQVKVRGYRIELGEVEAALAKHESVREAVVVVREEETEKQLIAYVVGATSRGELRRHLAGELPEYMIPTAFVMLEQMPLTPNGKVDRKALPAPDASRAGSDDAYVAPRSPVEEMLVQIWSDVLRLKRVGVHDNFFALGGHSLLGMQTVSRVRETLQVEAPLRSLFLSPTVAEFAEQLVSYESRPGQVLATARLRIKLAGMSAEEMQEILERKKKARG